MKRLVAEHRKSIDVCPGVWHGCEIRIAAHDTDFSRSERASTRRRRTAGRDWKRIDAKHCGGAGACLLNNGERITALGAAGENAVNQALSVEGEQVCSKCTVTGGRLIDDLGAVDCANGRLGRAFVSRTPRGQEIWNSDGGNYADNRNNN